jgi:tRNA U34 5-carboxymethylaminomethyl modifying enzyme MnmG/GidA
LTTISIHRTDVLQPAIGGVGSHLVKEIDALAVRWRAIDATGIQFGP